MPQCALGDGLGRAGKSTQIENDERDPKSKNWVGRTLPGSETASGKNCSLSLLGTQYLLCMYLKPQFYD